MKEVFLLLLGIKNSKNLPFYYVYTDEIFVGGDVLNAPYLNNNSLFYTKIVSRETFLFFIPH